LAGFAGIAAAASAKKRMDDFEEAKTFRSVRLETTAEGGFFGNLRDSELSALPSILEFSSQSRAETERDEDAQRLRFGGIERLEIIGPDGQPFDLRKRGGLRGLIAEIFALALRGGFYSEQHVRKARRDLGVAPIRESKVIETAEKVEEAAIDSLEGRLSARERAIEDIQRSIDEATSVVSAVDDEIASCADRVKEAMEATEEKRALTADLESNYLLHKQALGIVISSERPVEESKQSCIRCSPRQRREWNNFKRSGRQRKLHSCKPSTHTQKLLMKSVRMQRFNWKRLKSGAQKGKKRVL